MIKQPVDLTIGSRGKRMRILMLNDEKMLASTLKTSLQSYSEELWEVPATTLNEPNLWLKRQPNVLIIAAPAGTDVLQSAHQLQQQLDLAVLLICQELDEQVMESLEALQPHAVLVHPITEPQLNATLHLIRLSQYAEKQLVKTDTLSDREREVLQLVLKGFTSKEIGQRLYVSMNTVNTHKRRIKDKLGVRRWVEVRSINN